MNRFNNCLLNILREHTNRNSKMSSDHHHPTNAAVEHHHQPPPETYLRQWHLQTLLKLIPPLNQELPLQLGVQSLTTNSSELYSDSNSSVNQDPSSMITTTTPPNIPINNNPLGRTLSDSITSDYQQQQQMKKPLRLRSISEQVKKTDPESSNKKQSPYSKVCI